MPDRAMGPPRRARLSRGAALISVVIIALTFLAVAAINRLPVLFPDTMAYNSAGEAVLGAIGGHDRRARHRPPTAQAARPAPAADAAAAAADTGVSEARSPYYGVVLALADRIGGAWFAAAAQAVVAAVALLVALRRLDLRGSAGMAVVAVTVVGGLAFYAVTLMPDVFLGPVLLALAFLPSDRAMSRRERMFWAVTLAGGLLFHRGFLAVALVMVVLTAAAWRARWFSRRGWTIAAAATVIAAIGHAAVAPVVEHAYGAKMASPPFVLARMVEGRVVTAYLNDACPATPYLLCRLRAHLPMDHQQFLWALGPAGAFNTMSPADRQQLVAEAPTIVVRAVAARPVAASVEAAGYSLRQLVFAGMDDFAQRVPTRWRIDASLQPAMAVYPSSGIVAGDFPLHGVSAVTEGVYLAALAVLLAAAAVLARPAWFGRRAVAAADRRRVAAVVLIVAGIAVNAAVSGTLSGLQDRYTGRIAWLAALAAAALVAEGLAVTAPAGPRFLRR